MKYTLTVLLLMVLPAVAHPTTAQTRRSLSYEPQTVELDGRLVIQSKFGPPNYGEQPKTDQKVKVPVLVLSEPVNILAGKTDDGPNRQSVYNVKQIQLAFIESGTNYKNLIGQQVVVKGSLFHASTGHHYTDVVISVGSIERKPAGYDQQQLAVCNIFNFNPREGGPTSNAHLVEFRAAVREEATKRSFTLPKTRLMINVAVQLVAPPDSEFHADTIGIAIAVSEKEENAMQVSDRILTATSYERGWRLSVSRQVIVGDTEYRLSLSCRDGRRR